MTITDWNKEDSIVLGKNLKSGDCIRDKKGFHSAGIIIGINGLPRFYPNENHYQWFDINSPEDGPYSGNLNMEDEFIIINSRREILRYYDIVELALLRYSADLMDYRRNLIDIKKSVINDLNNKDKENKKIKKI